MLNLIHSILNLKKNKLTFGKKISTHPTKHSKILLEKFNNTL